jgi:hypothetical protein
MDGFIHFIEYLANNCLFLLIGAVAGAMFQEEADKKKHQ